MRAAAISTAFNCCLRIIEEDQRHPVAGWNADELPFGFHAPEPLGLFYNARQLANHPSLLCDQQGRLLDHVHRQDMRDLHLGMALSFGAHKTTAPKSGTENLQDRHQLNGSQLPGCGEGFVPLSER